MAIRLGLSRTGGGGKIRGYAIPRTPLVAIAIGLTFFHIGTISAQFTVDSVKNLVNIGDKL
jgi:hypothetical protein